MTSHRKIRCLISDSLELLELLNKILGNLDPLHLAIDIQKETQDKT
jgi:hypothetical protein